MGRPDLTSVTLVREEHVRRGACGACVEQVLLWFIILRARDTQDLEPGRVCRFGVSFLEIENEAGRWMCGPARRLVCPELVRVKSLE